MISKIHLTIRTSNKNLRLATMCAILIIGTFLSFLTGYLDIFRRWSFSWWPRDAYGYPFTWRWIELSPMGGEYFSWDVFLWNTAFWVLFCTLLMLAFLAGIRLNKRIARQSHQ
ncbi:MAG: hypothetical protein ACFFC7_29570 [Candidatus Hermodarchaeota archaeon]